MKKILTILFIALYAIGNSQITQRCPVCPPTLNGVPNGYVLTDSSGRAVWQASGGGGSDSAAWGLTGNAGTDPDLNYIGTSDNADLIFRQGGAQFASATFKNGDYGFQVSDTLGSPTINCVWDNAGNYSIQISATNSNIALSNNIIILTADTTSIPNGLKLNNGTQGAGKILTSDASGNATWQTLSGASGTGIPAYANNAAAFAALGAGKLYYTDVAGEYVLKLSH